MRPTTDEIACSLREEGLDSQDQGRSLGETSCPDRPSGRHPAPRRLDLEHLVGCILVLLGAGAAAADLVAALRRAGRVTGVMTGTVTTSVNAAREVGRSVERSGAQVTTDRDGEHRQIQRRARRIRQGVQPIRGSPPHWTTRR